MVKIQVLCQIHRVDGALSYGFSLGGPNFGVEYFRISTICLLLVYFVSAAGCHCFDLGWNG